MDMADSNQGVRTGQHEQLIQALCENNQHMEVLVSELTCQVSALLTAPSNVNSPQGTAVT